MSIEKDVVGLTVVYRRPPVGEPVDLDRALTQPTAADDNYLYGLYGKHAVAVVHRAITEFHVDLSSTGRVKVLVKISGNGRNPNRPDATLAGMSYLNWTRRAACRNAFQAVFFEFVVARHGNTKCVKLLRQVNTEDGFRQAMLAFPDCIASTMESTGKRVAVLPMRISFNLDLPVTIVAKRGIGDVLWSTDPDSGGQPQYCFNDATGARKALAPPVLPRPIITFQGRAGTRWRHGALHPESTSAKQTRVSP